MIYSDIKIVKSRVGESGLARNKEREGVIYPEIKRTEGVRYLKIKRERKEYISD